jgi:hypothetical protein
LFVPESTAETQPQPQPTLLRLSAMISHDFTRALSLIIVASKAIRTAAT